MSSWSKNVKFQNLALLPSSDKTMKLVWWIYTNRWSSLCYYNNPDWHHLTNPSSKFPTCSWWRKQNQASETCFLNKTWQLKIQGCWKVLSPTRKETNYSDRRFWFSYILFIIIIGGVLVLFLYITRLASNEIFSPSNKIHREVGRAKDLSAPRYLIPVLRYYDFCCKEVIFYLPYSAIYSRTCVEVWVAQILQKSRRRIKILGNRKFTGSTFHTENIRGHHTRCSRVGDMALGICAPLV